MLESASAMHSTKRTAEGLLDEWKMKGEKEAH